jgi:hypothetical protein
VKGTIAIASGFAEANVHADARRPVAIHQVFLQIEEPGRGSESQLSALPQRSSKR